MIVQELIDDKTVRTYSDKGVYIYGGFPRGNYTEAIDPIDQHRQYKETNIPIIVEQTEESNLEPKEKPHLHIEEDRLKIERIHQSENQ